MTATAVRPRRRHGLRWILLAYVALVASSSVVRWMHPVDGIPDPDELVQTVAGPTGPVRVAYRRFGPAQNESPPTIVLLHGSPGDNGEVTAVAERLGRRFNTIAPDLPGFGGSSWRVPDYSNLAHAQYLLALLDSLGIPSAHWVGFSMGGGVALQLQALAPGRVRSITMLAAIGAQEYELLGDYHLNHAIHGLQLAGLWLLREATPHFGWLDRSMLSVEYARNFYDTDQRPLRAILTRYAGPMLILHGEHDPLVSPAAAREHARIVPQARLILDQGDHFAAFRRPDLIAGEVADFVDQAERGEAATRATAQPDRLAAAAQRFDPTTIPRIEGLALVVVLLLIALSTLVSEDLAAISTGLMVARGTIGFWSGTVACFLGIFVGDVLVFLAGRSLGRAVLGRAPLRWFLSPEAVAAASEWVERKGPTLVFLTRFLPGTRLPGYFAAGMLRTSFSRFTLYFFIACALWTPALVGVSAAFGEVAQRALRVFQERAALYLLVTALVLFLFLKLLIPLTTYRGRRLLLSRWRRTTRWEFWPRWAFYPPLVLYVLWLGLKHKSLTLFTAVNPAIPGGGFVGESKAAILGGLADSPERVARYQLIPARLTPAERLQQVTTFREQWRLEWPVVLKPDIGERGTGVAIVRTSAEAETYLEAATGDTIVQEYVPGFEFGLFYVRRPGDERGTLFSITDKRFPAVSGDGSHNLEQLILADDRAVCMARFHLQHHARQLGEVPAAGEIVPLVELGTHCRGSLFLDGEWVRTPALEAAVDQLSRRYDGFWFGRYDVRTPDMDGFRRGENFKVVELNGATAEATAIYDPKNSLVQAYRTLGTQWRLLFEIAAANVARGARTSSWRELWTLVGRHRKATRGA